MIHGLIQLAVALDKDIYLTIIILCLENPQFPNTRKGQQIQI